MLPPASRLRKPQGGFRTSALGPPLEKPAYLRLERRGALLNATWSLDGKTWTRLSLGKGTRGFVLGRKVKVGVVAESTTPGEFKPEFDQFQLTLPGKPAAGRRAP